MGASYDPISGTQTDWPGYILPKAEEDDPWPGIGIRTWDEDTYGTDQFTPPRTQGPGDLLDAEGLGGGDAPWLKGRSGSAEGGPDTECRKCGLPLWNVGEDEWEDSDDSPECPDGGGYHEPIRRGLYPVKEGAFEFVPEHDGTLPVESAVYQALGGASMAWDETPTGVFRSEEAKDIGDKLLDVIHEKHPATAHVIGWAGQAVRLDLPVLAAVKRYCEVCGQMGFPTDDNRCQNCASQLPEERPLAPVLQGDAPPTRVGNGGGSGGDGDGGSDGDSDDGDDDDDDDDDARPFARDVEPGTHGDDKRKRKSGLAKEARHRLTEREKRELIDEDGEASNLDQLDLTGTSYQADGLDATRSFPFGI